MNLKKLEKTDLIKENVKMDIKSNSIYLNYWEKAKDETEFKELIKEDMEIKNHYLTGLILKNDWYYIRGILGDKIFQTYSEAGSVKIGNENFSILIPNGYGDGETRVAVIELEEKKNYNTDLFDFFTSVEGEINIYEHDCGDKILKTIKGRYGIYTNQGFVIFIRWE